jgi:signal transduction histidine kinase/CheY-like chemotaxis protein
MTNSRLDLRAYRRLTLAAKRRAVDQRLESALLSAIVDSLDDGLAVLDADGRVLLINRAFCRESLMPRVSLGDDLVAGWHEQAGTPDLLALLERVLRGDVSEGSWQTHLAGRRLVVNVRGLLGCEPAAVLVRCAVREDAGEAQPSGTSSSGVHRREIESVERAAGALAHDFNNLLTAVIGSTVSLRTLLERALDDTRSIDRAAGHASVLSSRLRTMSRADSREPQPAEIEQLVDELLPMLSAAAGAHVRISTSAPGSAWLVEVDAVELEQVLMNLVINARDAMGEEGGTVDIRIENLSPEESWLRLRERAEWVAVHVRDTGEGILPEYVGRVFEPFFTTKAKGRGTGLGLTNVREIIERSHGNVAIQSEPGRGTTVSVYLPRCHAKRQSLRSFPASFLKGSEVVLVVEDDYRVRITTARALSERGYKVLTASTAEEARRIERDYDGNIDVLLTDVGLPGSSGVELAAELTRRRPTMQVLYVSGHAEDVALGPVASQHGLLLKPYRPDELAARVRSLLDAAAEARLHSRLLGA